MKKRPITSQLTSSWKRGGVTIARWKSGQTANCHAESELRGEKADMRMKPDWLNDSQVALSEAATEDNYKRCSAVPTPPRIGRWASRTDRSTAAISGQKDVSRIRQSVVLIVNAIAKLGLPKSECRITSAMSVGSEYPIWQRRPRSSRSKVTSCTWQRGSVTNFNINKG